MRFIFESWVLLNNKYMNTVRQSLNDVIVPNIILNIWVSWPFHILSTESWVPNASYSGEIISYNNHRFRMPRTHARPFHIITTGWFRMRRRVSCPMLYPLIVPRFDHERNLCKYGQFYINKHITNAKLHNFKQTDQRKKSKSAPKFG